MIQAANNLFAILTFVGWGMILAVLYGVLTKNKKVLSFFSKKVLLLSFGVALVCLLGSLFYSEIAHFEPCKLCWYQRILMYPQVILFAYALKKKSKEIVDYAWRLSILGALIAGYHYLLQLGVVSGDCAAVGYSVSCTKNFVLQYGFISIPLMSLTGFLMLLAFALAYKKNPK